MYNIDTSYLFFRYYKCLFQWAIITALMICIGVFVATYPLILYLIPAVGTLMILLSFPEVPLSIALTGSLLFPLLIQDSLLSGFRIPFILSIALIGIFIRSFRASSIQKLSIEQIDVTLMILCLYLVLTLWWSRASEYGFQKWLGFLTLSVVPYYAIRFFCINRIESLWRIIWMCAVWSAVGVYIVLAVSIELGTLIPNQAWFMRRYLITEQYGIDLFGLTDTLSAGIICSIALIIRPGSVKSRILLIVLATSCFWGLITLGFRVQLIAAIFGVFIILIISGRRKRISTATQILSITILIIGVIVATTSSFRFSLEYLSQDISVSARLVHINKGWEMFYSNPLFGGGLGGYAMNALGNDERFFLHNIFLEVFVEGGLIGILIFSIFLFTFLKKIFSVDYHQNTHKANILDLMTVGIALFANRLIIATFSNDLQNVNWGTYLGIAVASSLHMVTNYNESAEESIIK